MKDRPTEIREKKKDSDRMKKKRTERQKEKMTTLLYTDLIVDDFSSD